MTRSCKRILAFMLTLLLSVSLVPRASAVGRLEEYQDLDPSAWYMLSIQYCLEHKLMAGYGKQIRTFRPDGTMTRAELVTMLWRMEDKPVTGLTMQYIDVPEGIWYEDAARWALSADVMVGAAVTKVAPEQLITREQLAVALWQYAKYRNGFVPEIVDPAFETYIDRDAITEGAVDAMRWANTLGIMTGSKDAKGNKLLTPWAYVDRASTSAVLMRFCLDRGVYD